MALYAADGSINVTVVDGTAITGLYAADGSWNVVVSDGVDHAGVYHPCGAYNVTVLTEGPEGIFATDGSLFVQESPYTYSGGLRVTAVSGSLSSLTAPVLAFASATDPDSDNTQDFNLTVTAPEVDDVLTLQWSTTSNFAVVAGSATYTILAADLIDLTGEVTTGALADGAWYFRAKHSRGATDSAWSNTVTKTIATTFDPLTLFSGGDTGFYFDFSDLSSMKQARDGTGSAPASNGDPVGHITDLFGSRVMAASADGRRPLYSTAGGLSGLLFDGSDDCLVGSAAWDFSGSVPEGTLCLAIVDDSAGTSAYVVIESSANSGGNANAIGLWVSETTAGRVTVSVSGVRYTGGHTLPFTGVHTAFLDLNGGDMATQIASIWTNAVSESLTTVGSYSAETHYGNHTWYLGARANASLRFKGTIYAALFITRNLTSGEQDDLETYFGSLAGLSI